MKIISIAFIISSIFSPVYGFGNQIIEDDDAYFYGVTPEDLTCIIVLNNAGRKNDAMQFAIKADKYIGGTNKVNMFQETGFSSFQDFALKMTVDEAFSILYSLDIEYAAIKEAEKMCLNIIGR